MNEKLKKNFLFILSLTLFLSGIVIVFKYNLITSPIDFKELMFLIVVIIFIPITLVLIKKNLLDKLLIGFSFGKSKLLTIVLGVIGGFIPFLISIFLFPTNSESISNTEIFRSIFLSPIWEEYLFRALIFSLFFLFLVEILSNISKTEKHKVLVKNVNLISAIFFTVAIFTVIHNDYSWSILFSSISFTLIFYLSKSIVSPIIAHIISNLLVSIIKTGFLSL